MVRYILVCLVALLLLAGCDNYTSGPRFKGDVYSIASMIISGQAINAEHPVYITRSADIDSFDPMNIFVTEAVVEITDLGTNESWLLSPMVDTQEMKLKWVDPAEHIIQPLHSYRIEVTIPGYDKTISAQTTVPQAVEVNTDYFGHNVQGEGFSADPENPSYLVYEESDLRYPLGINTFAGAGSHNVMVEMFCMEEFSTDLEFTTTIMGSSHPTEDMEDEYYSSGEGIRRISFLAKMTSSIQPEYTDNYIVLRDYRQAFVFYGRYKVTAYITDDNYYRYKYMPEGYLYGGVQNALGYFGSASGTEFYTRVVKQAPSI